MILWSFSKSVREEKLMNKSEIMTDQSLHEYPKQFLTNAAISISNPRGSFYVRSLEGEGTFNVFQLASKLYWHQRLPGPYLTGPKWSIVRDHSWVDFKTRTQWSSGSLEGTLPWFCLCCGKRKAVTLIFLFYLALVCYDILLNLWGLE